MSKPIFRFVPLCIMVLLTVLTCYAQELVPQAVIPSHARVHVQTQSLDSAQPDTISYDDGHVMLYYTMHNLWMRVRFTAPVATEIRSVYFVANNPNHVSAPCSVFVYLNHNGDLGGSISTVQVPGTVVHFGESLDNPIWNDFDLPTPLTVAANEDFFVVIGPQPGGMQSEGWHVLLDAQAAGRSAVSITGGHSGPYTDAPADIMLRVGGAPVTANPIGSITLISAGPPEWQYQLHRVSGVIRSFTLSDLCLGTTGAVSDDASLADWTVSAHADTLLFSSMNAVWGSNLSTFVLTSPTCTGRVHWSMGNSSGMVDGRLSVELVSFEAAPVDGAVQLSFATASEISNYAFEIYRGESADGEFRKIAEIESQGNTATGHRYSHVDAGVVAGKTYWYYLADVSLSGERTLHRDWMRSATAGSATLATDLSLSAFPNPFNPTTTLDVMLPDAQRVSLEVYDVTGKLVRTLADEPYSAGRHEVSFDAGNLPSGIYVARLQAGAVSLTKKLLLVK